MPCLERVAPHFPVRRIAVDGACADYYLQIMLGLSFASSRQAWCCFAAAAGSASVTDAVALTLPFGVTAGLSGAAVEMLVDA